MVISILAGGGIFKAGRLWVDWWVARQKHHENLSRLDFERDTAQDAMSTSIRAELRIDVKRLIERVDGLQTDVDQWRRSYYRVVEERESLRADNRRLTHSLAEALASIDVMRAQNSVLAGRVTELERLAHQNGNGV